MTLRGIACVTLFSMTLVLAACSALPTAATPPAPAFDFDAALSAVRASAVPQPSELEVQPIVDPADVDLQQQAHREVAAGRAAKAAELLDRALNAHPTNPVLLQERAEIALMLHRADGAMRFARASRTNGPSAGPLCRRAMETQLQVAIGTALPESDIASLRTARNACTVTPPRRY